MEATVELAGERTVEFAVGLAGERTEQRWRAGRRREEELAVLSAHLSAATARWLELVWELHERGDVDGELAGSLVPLHEIWQGGYFRVPDLKEHADGTPGCYLY